MTEFRNRNLGAHVGKDGHLFFKLNGRSSVNCDCIGPPYSEEVADLWEWHMRAVSMLRNAHNILAADGYLYASDIAAFLEERE